MALFKPFDMNFVRSSKPSILREVNISLASARNNEELQISGDFIHVLNQTGSCKIRINEDYAPQIDLRKIKRIVSPFYRIFLTNSAQTYGNIKLLVGTDAQLHFEERRTSIENLLQIESGVVTFLAGSGGHTLDLSGYKNVTIYFSCDKNCTFMIWTYPENASVLADYVYSEQTGLTEDNRKMTRVLDFPVGGLQVGIYNEDSADDLTYDLIITGEK